MISPLYKIGVVVQYNDEFLKIFKYAIQYIDIVSPMIILRVKSPNNDDSPYMYQVIQGDKQFETSEVWVELVK